MFNGTDLALNSAVDQDTLMFGSHELSLFIDESSHRSYKGDKSKIMTQQLMQLNNGAKETQH